MADVALHLRRIRSAPLKCLIWPRSHAGPRVSKQLRQNARILDWLVAFAFFFFFAAYTLHVWAAGTYIHTWLITNGLPICNWNVLASLSLWLIGGSGLLMSSIFCTFFFSRKATSFIDGQGPTCSLSFPSRGLVPGLRRKLYDNLGAGKVKKKKKKKPSSPVCPLIYFAFLCVCSRCVVAASYVLHELFQTLRRLRAHASGRKTRGRSRE